MIPRGTKVRKQLEFFAVEGWVIGEAQTRRGSRLCIIEVDPSKGSSVFKESQVFCCPEVELQIVGERDGQHSQIDDPVLQRTTD